MAEENKIRFQFISEPSDVNYGGKVHGGMVMKWIDQAAFACASNWNESYCVTVYVGGIRFYRPINIGDLILVDAEVIYTGSTSIHIAVDVHAKKIGTKSFEKKTHCVIVFVAVDELGKPIPAKKWEPQTEDEIQREKYAIKLRDLRTDIEAEMKAYL
jgi:acyl-CoA hydrolase